ncbi:NusG domain II-containing protein [Clostridiales bacterium FE2010]|nr:NusG domain II-containing protein [Clostridiales bacterium FE2010]
MKKKYLIAGAVVVIAVIAAVVLLLLNNSNNNSESRIQNSELNAENVSTAVPSTDIKEVPVLTAEPENTEAPAAEENDNSEFRIQNSELNAEPEKTEVPVAEKKDNKAEAEATDQPFLVQITDDDPSIAYVLVRMPNPIGLLPLPLEGEYSKTIRTKLADGSEFVNVLHLTPNGFRMEDANCEGHDCVNQGEVTLENREDRILWNMIICLPHQLSAELITREEALQMLAQ